ncbi:hypothetical protein B0T24DRAFT_610744 [Lasiosphaeria ovina]|uniref:Uncharacterized protein n=1 Tax=Lasiosphaeria ovina TaxID=92902 RepID=A0AAE0KMV9_9PEZI|nr:hypothetical protein B0T24DRAFT_610744 [Lasiosphaeria ovina]
MLQPSQGIRRRLKESLLAHAQKGKSSSKLHLQLHLIFLSAMLWTWREYVEGLRKDTDDMSEKAYFSRVENGPKHDYSLTFSDCQKLQLHQKKLLRASSVLDSWSDVIAGLEIHASDLVQDGISLRTCTCLPEIERIRIEIHYHKRSIARMVRDISGVENLLSMIFELRNSRHIQKLNQGASDNLDILKGIAIQGQIENKYLSHAAERAQQDSSSLKALSFIATAFIPGTFIATVFSSQLVQLVRNVDGSTDLVVVPQIWIYIVLSVTVTALTFAGVFLLQTRWKSRFLDTKLCKVS